MILKVEKDQNPYNVIERYIYEHLEVMEDMIAVLEIDGERTNELLEVDSDLDGFTWLNGWWEGEPEIALIDFFSVESACNPIRCEDCKHCGWMMEFETSYVIYKCAKHKCDTDLHRYCSWAERRIE